MARDITVGLDNALQASRVRPALLVKIGTSGADIFAWSGIGDLVWDGDTYLGVGTFGGIDTVEETDEVEATGTRLILTGVPTALISVMLQSMEQGRPAQIWLAALDLVTNALIADPYLVFEGLTDVPEIDDAGDAAAIAVSTENRLIKLETPLERRYTDLDQKLRDPTDRGFEYVPGLQDKQILFGSG
jgi:hypothetical protein